MRTIEKIGFTLQNRFAISFMVLLSFVFVISSCTPVHRLNRLKKVPREYRMNYCDGVTKSPRRFFHDRDPWIVFSDHSDNMTYTRAGGKISMKKVGFMDPLLVIGKKGDYLRVVKYDKEVVKNGKFADRKKAEYYGWIALKDVISSRNSVADLRSGRNQKYITIINDTLPLYNHEHLIDKDSIILYTDKEFTRPSAKIPFHAVVYRMKETPDRAKSLISKVSYLSPDSASSEVLGWVSNSLLRYIGQQRHISGIEQTDIVYREKYYLDTIRFSDNAIAERMNFRPSALKYDPVLSSCRLEDKIVLNYGTYSPAIDYRDNFVFNVNGNKIYYGDFLKIRRNLQKINLTFVIEGSKETIRGYPEMVNAIQELQSRIDTSNVSFRYTFSAVVGFGTRQKEMTVIHPQTSFMALMDSLSRPIDNLSLSRPVTSSLSWPALRQAVSMAGSQKDETNLLILIGETGYQSEFADSLLTRRMAENNCRLLGFQLYGGEPNSFNNFVLQVENMIDSYSSRIALQKRELLVSTSQLRSANQYKENAKNIYSLDFPQKSMTQGWVIFPEKNQSLTFDLLTNSVDSLVRQVREDNSDINSHLQDAFRSAGNYRSRFDSTLVRYFHIPTGKNRLGKDLADQFSEVAPYWYLPGCLLEIPDSSIIRPTNFLLLSVSELTTLRRILKALSSRQVDYKFVGTKKKKRDKCNCPDDFEMFSSQAGADTTGITPEYASTRKIRKYLYRLYLNEARLNKVCKIKKRVLKSSSIAILHELLLLCPTDHPDLGAFTVRQIKKKKIMDDRTLDHLLDYFKQKSDALENSLYKLLRFSSNGEDYYWINENMLP